MSDCTCRFTEDDRDGHSSTCPVRIRDDLAAARAELEEAAGGSRCHGGISALLRPGRSLPEVRGRNPRAARAQGGTMSGWYIEDVGGRSYSVRETDDDSLNSRHDRIVAENLTEADARLIAAAPTSSLRAKRR